METAAGSGRLTLLVTAAGVGPGMLTWPAWEVLRDVGEVVARDLDPRWVQALADAGVAVRDVPAGPAGPASDLAARLVNDARQGHVVWFVSPDGDPGLAEAITTLLARSPGQDVQVELVMGSYDLPGARLLDLVAVMDRLRSPGGCPWDAEQTHQSLLRYLIEEAYEVVEAVETGNRTDLREELGDLLLQVVFHARVASEDATAPFTVDDVATGIVDKLVRRHPHVFDDEEADSAAHVESVWERRKAVEKGRDSALDGIPGGLPALARAEKVLDRLHRHGVVVGEHVHLPTGEDVGLQLLRDVAAARAAGTSAEEALRNAVRRWEDDVRAAGF